MIDRRLHQDLLKIDEEVCNHLWRQQTEGNFCQDAPRLIFPFYRDSEKRRVSEQEARFAFAHVIESHCDAGYAYSVETPTCSKHIFRGRSKPNGGLTDTVVQPLSSTSAAYEGMSGQFDLTIYQGNDGCYNRLCNLEFKAGQPTGLWQDFSKLILDGLQGQDRPCGHYFHLLEHADRGTIPAVFDKFEAAFADERMASVLPETLDLCLMFTVCVLNPDNGKPQRAFSRVFECSDTPKSDLGDRAKEFFKADELRGSGSLSSQRSCLERQMWKIMEPDDWKTELIV